MLKFKDINLLFLGKLSRKLLCKDLLRFQCKYQGQSLDLNELFRRSYRFQNTSKLRKKFLMKLLNKSSRQFKCQQLQKKSYMWISQFILIVKYQSILIDKFLCKCLYKYPLKSPFILTGLMLKTKYQKDLESMKWKLSI